MSQTVALGLGLFVLFSLLIVLLSSAHRQTEQNSVRRALIEKFGSAHDLGEFLQSEGGRRFLADLSADSSVAGGAVVGSMQRGIVLVLVGIGCIGAGSMTDTRSMMGIGIVVLFAGIGFLVSSVVTHWLSKRSGLFGGGSGE